MLIHHLLALLVRVVVPEVLPLVIVSVSPGTVVLSVAISVVEGRLVIFLVVSVTTDVSVDPEAGLV